MTSDTQSLITEPTPSRRRWLKFSLRSLLVFITLVACFLSWIVYERSQSKFERQIGEKLQEQGCIVSFHGIYNRQLGPDWILSDAKPQGWWRDLARQFLGERIWLISYHGGLENIPLLAELKDLKWLNVEVTSATDLAPLAELKNLKGLGLQATSVSDFMPLADLTPLAELEKLESLVLIDLSLDGLTPLAGFSNSKELHLQSLSDLTPPLTELKDLERLGLQDIYVDDLTSLAELANLKELFLNSSVSDEQVESLQQALPNCSIIRE